MLKNNLKKNTAVNRLFKINNEAAQIEQLFFNKSYEKYKN